MSFRQQEAVQPQPALDLLTAISGTKSLSMLDGFCRALWIDWGAGRLTDEQAQSLSEAIEARRREVRGIDRLAVRALRANRLVQEQPSRRRGGDFVWLRERSSRVCRDR